MPNSIPATVSIDPAALRAALGIDELMAAVGRIEQAMSRSSGSTPTDDAILVDAKRAAEMLGMSVSWLWENSGNRGMAIPMLKLGTMTRYRVETLKRFMEEREAEGAETVPVDAGAGH